MALLDSFLRLIDISQIVEYADRIELELTVQEIASVDCDFSEWLNAEVIGLTIDDQMCPEWSDIGSFHAELACQVILFKDSFIREFINKTTDINTAQYVFFSVAEFSNWLCGLPSPLDGAHPFHQRTSNVIWVHGLSQPHRGHKLAIIPLDYEGTIDFSSASCALPSDAEIRSQVHFLSNNPVRVDPFLFRLPDTSFDTVALKPLFVCYEKILGACLVKEYVSEDSVVVSGIKRLNLSLYRYNNQSTQLENIRALEEAVCWIYAERFQTRSLLLMDRISLDITENGNFIPEIYSHLEQALKQAKDRYEFVIKDRKEAHAKELSQLQKDIKVATDSHSAATNDLICGLFRDVLSSIFFVTLMLFPRLIGNKDILQGGLGAWLFYVLAMYLLVSVGIRIYAGWHSLKLSLRDIDYWQNTTRNHMSEAEFRKHVASRTKPYKRYYYYNALWIIIVYIILAVLVFRAPELLQDNKGLEVIVSGNSTSRDVSPQVSIEIPKTIVVEDQPQPITPANISKDSAQHISKKSDSSPVLKGGEAGSL